MSESLSYEVEPYGINVILIEPGVINTNFVENIVFPDNTQEILSSLLSSPSSSSSLSSSLLPSSKTTTTANSSLGDLTRNMDKGEWKETTKYSDIVKRFLSHYYPAMSTAPDPKEIAQVILESIQMQPKHSVNRRHNLFRYPVGQDAKLYAEAKKKICYPFGRLRHTDRPIFISK